MGIDIRATVTCSLGTLISANLSDDYIQGTGLVKTRGSCELRGLFTPNTGDKVTFRYTKAGITRRVPRALRVLSSFADPFRRTTKIELGCKLTYLQDLADPIDWTTFDDPENADIDPNEPRIVVIPINAKSIMNKCLTELGITATSNPLTNRFSIDEFDFSGGYVNILSDLLVSESYCGYLNLDERLVVFPLNEKGGNGPLVDSAKLIDIGPIGVGQLPGDAVTVSYSSLKLKASELSDDDDPQKDSPWGDDYADSSNASTVAVTYETDAGVATQTYARLQSTKVSTNYTFKQFRTEDGKERVYKNVINSRLTVENDSAVGILGSYVTQALSLRGAFGNFSVSTFTDQFFSYDEFGRETFSRLVKTGSRAFGLGMLGISFVYDGELIAIPEGSMLLEEVEVSTAYSSTGRHQQTITRRYGPWPQSISGQQTLAETRDSIQTAAQANALIQEALLGRYLIDTTVSSEATGSRGQEAPSVSVILNGRLGDGGDPDFGFTTESTAQLELSVGDPTAQLRVEFQMPYAPDDVFTRVQGGYTATPSDAPQKANTFGRVQNRMLLGNRSGMNIQVAPEVLPSNPFAPVFVEAAGTINLYRLNGTSWTMDASGIVASSDAMFWGTAGKKA
jgi:hypothetical protein